MAIPSPQNGSTEGRSLGGPCNHTYHLGCLLRWMGTDTGDVAKCPLCRHPIKMEESKKFKFVEVEEGVGVPESEKYHLAELNIKKLLCQLKLMNLGLQLERMNGKLQSLREKHRRELRVADHLTKSVISTGSIPAVLNVLRSQVAGINRRREGFNATRGIPTIDLDDEYPIDIDENEINVIDDD